MPNQLRTRLGAAATGAVICSLLGPTLGALAMLTFGAINELSVHDVVSWLETFPFALLVAVMLMGPAAFVLGGVGALAIQYMSTRVRPAKTLFLRTAILGLVFGGAVPVFVDLVYAAFGGGRNKNFETGLLPLGAVTGLVCAAVVYWLLRRMRLLSFQQSDDSEAA